LRKFVNFAATSMRNILEISLLTQLDANASRQRTRQIAELCGFRLNEQTRLSTTVSELARGAVDDDRPGKVRFALLDEASSQALVITVSRHAAAPGAGGHVFHLGEYTPIPSEAVLAASYRFMDRIEVDQAGDTIVLHKTCPATGRLLDAEDLKSAMHRQSSFAGAAALSEARQRNRELEVSNEGFVARNGQLQAQADSLISADQKKDEFLAILAHELRGPLSAMAMAGQALQRNPNDPERTAQVGQMIGRQTAHMTRIVEDLLDVSRIVRNEVSIERQPVDLCEAVLAAVEQLTPAAQRRSHRVTALLPESPVFVQGDRTRLIQVMGNLIGNAIRYTPSAGRIDVALEGETSTACLTVTDNGIGIPAELLPSLFDLFVQAHRSTDSRDSGLGLGLALVKTLVEAHEGSVIAHSDGPGSGSRFEIRLPRLYPASEPRP
jgi:signal transduction histidine kinase/anti-sigma regulatory factor (Ser/Thr protein kinase)